MSWPTPAKLKTKVSLAAKPVNVWFGALATIVLLAAGPGSLHDHASDSLAGGSRRIDDQNSSVTIGNRRVPIA